MNLTSANTRFERLRASDVTKSVNANMPIGASGTISVWNPGVASKFVLKGWRIVALTTGGIDTAAPFVLQFVDSVAANGVYPVFGFEMDPPDGVVMQDEGTIPDGWTSGAVGRVLKLTCTSDIISGTLFVSCCVWGEER